jgi:hypothetical protein
MPDGGTLLMFRFQVDEVGSKFIDNADAICERRQGYTDSLCRSVVLGAVERDSTILLRLPYITR